MSLLKSKKLWIPVSLIGISIVAIGTGVGVNAARYAYIPSQEEINNFTSSLNANSIEVRFSSDQKNTSVEVNKKNASNTLVSQNIADLFAFNIRSEHIVLKKSVNVPNNTEVKFSIGTFNNSSNNLNQGELNIEVIVSTKNNIQAKKIIVLTGFKQAGDSFKNILNSTNSNQLDFSLNPITLDKKQASQPQQKDQNNQVETYNNLVSIEELNKVVKVNKKTNKLATLSWLDETKINDEKEENDYEEISLLTYWLRQNSSLSKKDDANNVSDITVIGKVKLDRIVNENNKAYFYLVSSDVSKPLSLVRKDANGKIINQTAIDEIKTTNLLASDVSIVPLTQIDHQTEAFKQTLKDIKETVKDKEIGYLTNIVDERSNKELSLKLFPTFLNPNNNIFIKPYVIKDSVVNSKSNIWAKLVVSFGSGNEIKQYDTSIVKDVEELKQAGFSFDIYSKQLTNNNTLEVKPTDIGNLGNVLFKYLFETEYVIPNDKNAYDRAVLNTEKDGIKVTDFVKGFSTRGIEINKSNNTAVNYLLFANYTYNGLDNKVLFTPSLSLVHVQ